MNLERLAALVSEENLSTAIEDRIVYGRDASRLEGECLAVVWPSRPEQVAAIVEWGREEGINLVPRGAGTGLCGGAVPYTPSTQEDRKGSVVVDLSRLTKIGPVDVERCRVRVEAGVVLGTLNRHLATNDLLLPVIPGSHQAASIGGMIATDAAGLHAVRYGTMRNWVEEITLVDGLGRVHRLTEEGMNDIVGWEGITGFVTEATVRLIPSPTQRTVSLLSFEDEEALLTQRDRWLADPRLTALEYVNRHAARAIGWEARPHLLAEFDSDGGEIADPQRVAALWRARDGLYPVLARSGYPVIEDPEMNGEGLASLLAWLEAEGIPAFGHLGVGIVHPCFRPDDERVPALYERVAEWGGRVSGEHGIGLKKKDWTDAAFRAEARRLKERYDPQQVINRGKLC
ncbi:MAG TPA: FAD-binding oxidoreductase [Caldilineae bacterium]|nr:FAD-binding oxidoreductase [Caldilineae bacterium]